MNTRLQVEHPVTEAVTGRDLVADQLRIAGGETLAGSGCDAAARSAATRSRRACTPRIPRPASCRPPGRLLALRWPEGVRVDTGVREGDDVSDRYDPMLAKLIAHGRDPATALDAAAAALDATRDPRRAHQPALPALAARPARHARRRDADRYDRRPRAARRPRAWRRRTGRRPRCALDDRHRRTRGRRLAAQRRARPAAAPRRRGARRPPRRRTATGPDRSPSATATRVHVDVDGQSLEFALAPPPTVEEAVRHARGRRRGRDRVLIAPMPGRVIAVRVAEGASVQRTSGRRHRGDEDGARGGRADRRQCYAASASPRGSRCSAATSSARSRARMPCSAMS